VPKDRLTREQWRVVIVALLFFLLLNVTGPRFRDPGAVERWWAAQDKLAVAGR
jgi:hypothetical protein